MQQRAIGSNYETFDIEGLTKGGITVLFTWRSDFRNLEELAKEAEDEPCNDLWKVVTVGLRNP